MILRELHACNYLLQRISVLYVKVEISISNYNHRSVSLAGFILYCTLISRVLDDYSNESNIQVKNIFYKLYMHKTIITTVHLNNFYVDTRFFFLKKLSS